MKKVLFYSSFAFIAAFSSCSDDDATNSLDDVNEKYLSSMTVNSTESSSGSSTVTVMYDTDGKVSSITDGTDSNVFVYNSSNELTTVSGSGDAFSMSELYVTPYDGYEFGEVLEYDSNGNPIKLRLFDRDYDGSIMEEFVGEITYDDEPNPFLYTMNAAGILDVLDNVEINFAAPTQAQELVIAKSLLPVNNPNKFVLKNLAGVVQGQVVAQYVYDNDGYPTSATFTETGDGEIIVSTATYTYLP